MIYGCGNHEYRLKLYPEQYGDLYEKARERLKRQESAIWKMRRRILPSAAVGPDLRLCHGPHLLQPLLPRTAAGFGTDGPPWKTGSGALRHSAGASPCLPQLLCIIWSRSDAFRPLSRRRGGPWRAPGLVTPDFRLFSKNCRGLFLTGGTCQIISAGTGEHTIPVRIWNRRELIITDIGKT